MPGTTGFPDWQKITQWLSAPLDTGTGINLDGGPHVAGPFEVYSYASIIVCLAAHGGTVNVTVTQSVPGGPPSLSVPETFTVPAGDVIFKAFVLDAASAEVTFSETAPGTTVDYAIVPSNSNLNTEAAVLAQLGFQHNGVAVATESNLDLEDSSSVSWTLTDDPVNARMKVAATAKAMLGVTVILNGTGSYTAPAGAAALEVDGVGGGGGSGGSTGGAGTWSAGGGGGSGAYSAKLLTANIGTHSVAVAAGGAAGGLGGTGGTGGDTTFKDSTGTTVLVAKGGLGGAGSGANAVAAVAAGGAGGAASAGTGDLKADGTGGGPGLSFSAAQFLGGHGAPSYYGGGAAGQNAGAGIAGGQYGGGASGSISLGGSRAGAVGGNGVLRVRATT